MKAADGLAAPGPLRRVGFTCDFLRFAPAEHGYSSFQPRNLAWLSELLTGAGAWAQHGVQIAQVLPPEEPAAFERALGDAAALADYRADADHAWARRYDAADPEVFAPVFERLCEQDLVVGFEMAPSIRRRLHAGGRPYVNFYVHPLRFLRDLCVGITTNSAPIAALVRGHEIARHEVDNQVRRFRALFLRQRLAACAVPDGLPVLVGQTERDSVLVRNGRFFGWEDCADSLHRQLADFDAVVFLDHPYRPSSSGVHEYLRSMHGKTVIATNANGYGVLLGQRGIPAVLTLASSLGVEAQAMQLETHFLLDDPRRRLHLPEQEPPTPGACGHGVLGAPFWAAVLDGDQVCGDASPPQPADDFQLGEHYLRNSLDAWSFRPLQHGLATLSSRKTLVPAAGLSPARRDALLAGLLGDPVPSTPTRALARAQALGLQLTLLDPPLAQGERREVVFDGPAAASYLADGFDGPGLQCGWTSARHAALVIPVIAPTQDAQPRLDITLELRAAGVLLAQAPQLGISCAGTMLGSLAFGAAAPNPQSISFSVRPSAPLCRIDLDLSDREPPPDGAASELPNRPGYAVIRLAVHYSAG